MCFRLIDAKKSQHPVSLLCSVLGVSRAGYYAWKDRPASARRRRDDRLTEQISQVDAESNGTYGWPRIHAELRHRGVHVSRKRRSACPVSPPHRTLCAATSVTVVTPDRERLRDKAVGPAAGGMGN
jgi:predicted nucleic acid-binding protein